MPGVPTTARVDHTAITRRAGTQNGTVRLRFVLFHHDPPARRTAHRTVGRQDGTLRKGLRVLGETFISRQQRFERGRYAASKIGWLRVSNDQALARDGVVRTRFSYRAQNNMLPYVPQVDLKHCYSGHSSRESDRHTHVQHWYTVDTGEVNVGDEGGGTIHACVGGENLAIWRYRRASDNVGATL